MNMQYEVSEHF